MLPYFVAISQTTNQSANTVVRGQKDEIYSNHWDIAPSRCVCGNCDDGWEFHFVAMTSKPKLIHVSRWTAPAATVDRRLSRRASSVITSLFNSMTLPHIVPEQYTRVA